MNELQKLESFRYALAVAQTFDEIKLIKDATSSFAELARLQQLSIEKQNEVGLFRLEITAKVGAWLDEHYPSNHAGPGRGKTSYSDEPVLKMPASKKESADSRLINREPELVDMVISDIIEADEIITPGRVAIKIREKIKGIEVIEAETVDAEVIEIEEVSDTYEKRIEIMELVNDSHIETLQFIYKEAITLKSHSKFIKWLEGHIIYLIQQFKFVNNEN